MSHYFSEVFKQLVSNGKATLVMKTDPLEQPVSTVFSSVLEAFSLCGVSTMIFSELKAPGMIIKQLLDEVFVISRIIKVESNNCFIIH